MVGRRPRNAGLPVRFGQGGAPVPPTLNYQRVDCFRNGFTWSSARALGRGGSETRPYKTYCIGQLLRFPTVLTAS